MSIAAQGFVRASVSEPTGNHTLYKRLLLGTALAALVTAPALANPTGGQVATGSATISSSGNNTAVKQTSEGVVINWSSFNIGNGQTTQFYQPNAKAIAVNRIGSKNASQILGTLDANGNVVLINGNGILFGKGAKVDVGSLVATSTDGSDSDVLSGKFTKAGSQSATIVNHGVITVNTGGTVALVAPNVTNSGTVNAKLGTVSLGAANKFTVDLNGDGLVSFAAQGDVNGKVSVTNRGRLVGANVSMTAHAAEGIATGVVNTSGVIVAKGAHEVGGTIVLDGGDGGSIDISGGKLEAKGPKGGGSIIVGSWDDSSVTVSSDAILNASAMKAGDGGHIKVVSNTTSFTGNALAQGGILSGNGGLIETSGHTLDFLGSHIDGSARHGKAGTWLLDPDDLDIDSADATDISNTLGASGSGTNVSLQTTSSGCSGGFGTCVSGSGDINIDGAISWGSSATLSLDAYHSLNILAPISITGAGSLALQYNDEATDGTLSFGLTSSGFTGGVNYGPFDNGGKLSINSVSYTLVYDLPDFVHDVLVSSGTGNFAFATSYDTSGSDYAATPIPSYASFTGTLEGLGNSISGLNINDGSYTDVGLFGEIGSGGVVRDLALTHAIVASTIASSADVGILAGQNDGTIINVTVTGSAADNNENNTVDIGGLVGLNTGSISYSNAGASVSGNFEPNIGGLVGDNENTISYSYATGAVAADDGGTAGGLVGLNGSSAFISYSYATGAVGTAANTTNAEIGGLVGQNENYVDYSYATGAVSGNAGNFAGGLIGYNNLGSINDSYAMGAVTSGENAYVGGLIGNDRDGSIEQAYATGAVLDTASGASVGGLIGDVSDFTVGAASADYWDTATSGIANTNQGTGNRGDLGSSIAGEMTANLQGTLPGGFDNTVWGTGSGLYPYFLWQYPSDTPQTITGTAYTDAGVTKDAGDTVTGYLGGNSLNTASTGANGYYYFLLAPGTLTGTQTAYVATPEGATAVDNLSASQSSLDIWGNYFRDFTAESSLSAALNDVSSAVGGSSTILNFASGLPNQYIQSSATSFSLDEEFTSSGNTTVKTTAGDITVDAEQDQPGGTLTLDSYGNIFVRQEMEIATGANLTFVTNDGGSGGHLDFQGGDVNFQSASSNLTINSTPYTIVLDLPTLFSDIASNSSGDYALGNSYLDASSLGTLTRAPIANFTGKLEGLGSQIDNLTINSSGADVGLFAQIASGASVENLLLTNLSVTGTASGVNVGGLVGSNSGSIYNVYVAGSVSGAYGTFGEVGGFVGVDSGNIGGSGFSGSVAGDNVGGFAGSVSGTITDSYALGSLTSDNEGGGFAEQVSLTGNVGNSYTTVALTSVTSGPDAAVLSGFVVVNLGTISDSYTAGTLSPEQVAGFAQANDGTITGSAWDEDTTGASQGVVLSGSGAVTDLTGLTATNAYSESTYTGLGWNFGAGGDWYMIDGQTRPFLQSEYSTYILNAHQLQLMSMNLTENYVVGENITYDGTMWSSAGFVPVGSEATPFEGGLEGADFSISNLTIDRPTQDYVGLIGYSCGCGELSDITFVGGSITGQNYVGALAGYIDGELGGIISSVNVTGNEFVGGIVGYADSDTLMEGVESSGAVAGLKAVGGIAGYNDGGIFESEADGTVTGLAPTGSNTGGAIGGFVGFNDADAGLEEDIATGNVTANGTATGITTGAGGFVGMNFGEIEADGALGNVSGQKMVGGFAGYNDGPITAAFSGGKATGDLYVGGFIGFNDAEGGIIDSYSLGAASVTGSVGGKDGDVGGFVGTDVGYIQDTYSTGMVTCTAAGTCAGTLGGFSGDEDGDLAGTNAFDIYTSGIAASQGIGRNLSGAEAYGVPTFILQGGLPSGWDTSTWAILPGESYPYLQWQTFGETPQVVSGLVENGTKTASGVSVGVVVDGQTGNIDVAMASGADGYFYDLLVPNSISAGSNVVAYIANPGITGNTFETEVTGSLLGVGVHEGELAVHSSDADSGLLTSDLSEAMGSQTGPQFLYTSAGGFASGTQTVLFETAGTFDVDSALNVGTGSLDIIASGNVTEDSGTGSITANEIEGSSVGGVTLNGANEIAGIQGWSNSGSGGFALTTGEQLRIGGEISAGSGDLDLTTTSGGMNIDGALVAGGTVDLSSAGAISENATAGSIDAAALEGSSHGGVSLAGANMIGDIDGFDTNGGPFTLANGETLTTLDTITATGATVSLTTTSGDIDIDGTIDARNLDLDAHGAADENSNGSIVVHLLNVTAGTGIDLDSDLNSIGVIGTDTTTTGSNTIDKS